MSQDERRCRGYRKRYMQRIITQQVLVGTASLWGDSAHCENLFGKANRSLLVAVEEIYARLVPFRGGNHCRLSSAKNVLKTSQRFRE